MYLFHQFCLFAALRDRFIQLLVKMTNLQFSLEVLPYWVVSASVCRNEHVSLFRLSAAGLVGASTVVGFKNRIDHRPGGLNRILAGEECPVAGHGITQEPLVEGFLSLLFIQQVVAFDQC